MSASGGYDRFLRHPVAVSSSGKDPAFQMEGQGFDHIQVMERIWALSQVGGTTDNIEETCVNFVTRALKFTTPLMTTHQIDNCTEGCYHVKFGCYYCLFVLTSSGSGDPPGVRLLIACQSLATYDLPQNPYVPFTLTTSSSSIQFGSHLLTSPWTVLCHLSTPSLAIADLFFYAISCLSGKVRP
ncbi:hypothetical protein E3N88_07856 [Mikania micrantha]|uniref:Uncharacterized protein n=1 Tax=Mikania micrantha TaxID=192012 RepID=A0A5N6PGK6_9ASTR|nr:hypothetical protein E3N88_07856 [Mikania micrantha]